MLYQIYSSIWEPGLCFSGHTVLVYISEGHLRLGVCQHPNYIEDRFMNTRGEVIMYWWTFV